MIELYDNLTETQKKKILILKVRGLLIFIFTTLISWVLFLGFNSPWTNLYFIAFYSILFIFCLLFILLSFSNFLKDIFYYKSIISNCPEKIIINSDSIIVTLKHESFIFARKSAQDSIDCFLLVKPNYIHVSIHEFHMLLKNCLNKEETASLINTFNTFKKYTLEQQVISINKKKSYKILFPLPVLLQLTYNRVKSTIPYFSLWYLLCYGILFADLLLLHINISYFLIIILIIFHLYFITLLVVKYRKQKTIYTHPNSCKIVFDTNQYTVFSNDNLLFTKPISHIKYIDYYKKSYIFLTYSGEIIIHESDFQLILEYYPSLAKLVISNSFRVIR